MTPVVVTHGRTLLEVDHLSITVRADVRRPEELLARPDVRAHLDFAQPVAIMLIATLPFLPDADDPAGIVARLRDAVVPGSYLAIAHIGTEFFPDKKALARTLKVDENASEQMHPRSRERVLGFFDGFELVEPGVVPKDQWRPEAGEAVADPPTSNGAE